MNHPDRLNVGNVQRVCHRAHLQCPQIRTFRIFHDDNVAVALIVSDIWAVKDFSKNRVVDCVKAD